mgnify:CR=1 FL=1
MLIDIEYPTGDSTIHPDFQNTIDDAIEAANQRLNTNDARRRH